MKKIKCDWVTEDFLKLKVSDYLDVIVTVKQNGKESKVHLSPDKIRKLRKQLKRALVEIERVSGETL